LPTTAVGSLIARQAEVSMLVELLDSNRSPGAIVLIEGPPGIGKTALWRAGLGLAAARGTTVLEAHPSEAERRYPYAVVADLLQDVGDLPACAEGKGTSLSATKWRGNP